MSVPRADFTATVLKNGRVLLVGGETLATADTATVDLFEPATGSVMAAKPMKTPRNGHTATLLPDGRVLVTGGSTAPLGAGVATAEIYDPAANTWAAAASMAAPRVHHAAALLPNGRVFVVGGTTTLPSPEVYDPATNTWTSTSGLTGDIRPQGATATVFGGGKVMVVGGEIGDALTVTSDVEIYDSSTGQYTFNQSPPGGFGRNWATAALLADGTVMYAGGQSSVNPGGAQSSVDIFDPTNSGCRGGMCQYPFNAGAAMSVGHCHHTMTLLSNGLVLVAGGRCGSAESVAVAELYDHVARRWWPAAPLQDPRGYHVAVLLQDGRVFVAGGIFPGGTIASGMEIYTPAAS